MRCVGGHTGKVEKRFDFILGWQGLTKGLGEPGYPRNGFGRKIRRHARQVTRGRARGGPSR